MSTFTAENRARLLWEISDEPDAPDMCSGVLVRALLAAHDALQEQVREMHTVGAELQAQERVEFIRQAAIQFGIETDDDGAQLESPQLCWRRARSLWNSKPEDC